MTNEYQQAAEQILKAERINIVCGAGISVACGIPDFRSPGTGLYSHLQQYCLPFPTAMFDLEYLYIRPRPFYTLTASIFPDLKIKPSYTHCFFKLLQDKNKLEYIVTQNIDDIEKHVGVKHPQKLSQAHGSFTNPVKCVGCPFTTENCQLLKAASVDEAAPHCPVCGRLLKPGVVFFGENLPEESSQYSQKVNKCDLQIILGTSLQVGPVNQLPVIALMSKKDRILINNQVVGDFTEIQKQRVENDTVLLGDCDQVVIKLCEQLNWKNELQKLYQQMQQQSQQQLQNQLTLDNLQIVGLTNSLIVPNAQTTQQTDFSSTVKFQNKLMFAAITQEQLKLLQQATISQQLEINISQIPKQLQQHHKGGIIWVFDKKVQYNNKTVYSPVLGHFSAYITQYVRIKKINDDDQVWDLISRYEETKVGETNKLVKKIEDESNKLNCCFISNDDMDKFIESEAVEDIKLEYELYTVKFQLDTTIGERKGEVIETKFKLVFDQDDKEAVYNQFNQHKAILVENVKDLTKQQPLNMELKENILKIEFGRDAHGDLFDILKNVVVGFFKKQGVSVQKPK